MDRQVRISVGAFGLAKRVGGDEWLAIYKTESIEPVAELLRAYHKEQEFLVGWKSTGDRDGEVKVAERTVPAKLVRSLRCIYGFTDASQDTSGLIDKLLEHNYGLPPDTPLALSDVVNMKKSRWSCVSDYPSENPFCPFCEGRDFDWDDGDSSVYSGSGACRVCGASVDISEASNSSPDNWPLIVR